MKAAKLSESLSRYSGEWTADHAGHLLRRVVFGPKPEEIEAAAAAGLDATLDRLFTVVPESDPADSALLETARSLNNPVDLKSWWLHRLLTTANPLVERMTLFWHNHFATSIAKVTSTKLMADQNELFRTRALGNFGELVAGVARDPAMVVWLDGNSNRRRHANENFARELMELFTLGVGNYTEADIQEAARAFTGWHTRLDQFWFNAGQHDEGVKTVLGKTGPLDGDDVIAACLAQRAAPRFLATKLLRTFVVDQPSPTQIESFADAIVSQKFAIGTALRQLLASDMFYAPAHRACLIKGPLDYSLGTVRLLGATPRLPALVNACARQGQDVFEPPSVEGWKGGRRWINSASLLERANFAHALLGTERFGYLTDLSDRLGQAGSDSAEAVVDGLAHTLLATPVSAAAREQLSNYWQASSLPVNERLRAMAGLFLSMPEYHLM